MRAHGPLASIAVAAVLALAILSMTGCCEEESYDPREQTSQPAEIPAKSGFEARYVKGLMFQGKDLPLRTKLIYETPLGLDKYGVARGSGTLYFSEPSGKQTTKFRQTFEFNGKYDAKTGQLSGPFRITIEYVTEGGGMTQRVDGMYRASGTLTAKANEDRQLAGTATGSSTLKETYSGNNTDPPPLDKKAALSWTVSAYLE